MNPDEQEDRCCLCLFAGPLIWPSCCLTGAMHKECAYDYVRYLRVEDSLFIQQEGRPKDRPGCPGCRRTYENRDVILMVPDRRLFECRGVLHPLNERSRFRVVVYEEYEEAGLAIRRYDHLIFYLEPGVNLPTYEYRDIIWMLPDRRLFECRGVLRPLNEQSRISVVVYEDHEEAGLAIRRYDNLSINFGPGVILFQEELRPSCRQQRVNPMWPPLDAPELFSPTERTLKPELETHQQRRRLESFVSNAWARLYPVVCETRYRTRMERTIEDRI